MATDLFLSPLITVTNGALFVAFLIAFPLLNPLSGQPGFNQVQEFNNYGALLQKVIVHQDTIIGYGATRSAEPPYQWCIWIARFDSTGSFIDSARICDPFGGTLTQDQIKSDLVRLSNGHFGMTASHFSNSNGLYLQVNENLELTHFVEFIDTLNLGERYYSIIEISDGYLLGGYIVRPNLKPDGFLRKIDKQGNELWFKYLGAYNVYDAFTGYYRNTDTTIIATGGYQYNVGTPIRFRPWLLELDLDGNILREWKPQSDVGISFIHYFHPVSPQKWLIWGKHDISPNNQTEVVHAVCALLDTSFQLTGVLNLGGLAPYRETFWQIVQIPGGDFLGAGEITLNKPGGGLQEYGWLMRFSENLDTLWSRTDLAPVPGGAPGEIFLAGAGALSSGNIIAGGTARTGSQYYCWLVKVNADGCIDTLFCNTIATEIPPEISRLPMSIYPNPAQDHFTVDVAGWNSRQVRLELHGADGRRWREGVFDLPAQIDCAGLPRGMYFVSLYADGALIGRERVVVIR